MGFIERLRQQKIVAEQVRTQQEAALQRKSKAETEAETIARQHRSTKEEEYHQQRRLQSETFRQESGAGILVKTLGEILLTDGQGTSMGPDYVGNGGGYAHLTVVPQPSLLLTDPDSLLDIAVWDVEQPGYPEFKFLGVESCPDGSVMFRTRYLDGDYISAGEKHACATEIVQEQIWRNNPNALEAAVLIMAASIAGRNCLLP